MPLVPFPPTLWFLLWDLCNMVIFRNAYAELEEN